MLRVGPRVCVRLCGAACSSARMQVGLSTSCLEDTLTLQFLDPFMKRA